MLSKFDITEEAFEPFYRSDSDGSIIRQNLNKITNFSYDRLQKSLNRFAVVEWLSENVDFPLIFEIEVSKNLEKSV